jgi:predicted cation transporter
VIMGICSSRPILQLARSLVGTLSRLLPFQRPVAVFVSTLAIGPLLGSFITEPAAMTVSALLLSEWLFSGAASSELKYATLGLLFVNVSIGGTLTPYAAPPILMIAPGWNWDVAFMFTHFGWKAILAVLVSTLLVTYRFRRELASLGPSSERSRGTRESTLPAWVIAAHLLLLSLVVAGSGHAGVFAGVFLLFLCLVRITREHQGELRLREGLLVAFFLSGLVVLGEPQRWWLEPILSKLHALPLYLGTLSLTAITDNAALTYLGSQVSSLSELSRYALVAGSVVGGGLTVIANAPNLVGYGILNPSLGDGGISPLRLFANALLPTLISGACFWFL